MKQTIKLATLSLVAAFLQGCAENSQDYISELSFKNFDVYTNRELPKNSDQLKEALPPTEVLEGDEKVKNISTPFEWTPSGGYDSAISPSCVSSNLEKILSSSDQSTLSKMNQAQSWLSSCESELVKNNDDSISPLIRFMTVHYSMLDNKRLKKVKIKLSSGVILRGILGLKGDDLKRPMIIIQGGVQSNAEDSGPNRNFIMQVFDESPFNILFLGSVTGSEYLKDNGVIALGGMEEGQHIVEVAQVLQSSNSKLSRFISSVHVLGVSLGSHGALYSSLYNSYLQDPPIKSVMAYCPVVNLEPTMDSVFDGSPRGLYYNFLTVNMFKSVFSFVPIIGELLGPPTFWDRVQTLKAVKEAALIHYQDLTKNEPWPLEPFKGKVVNTDKDLWQFNNFLLHSNQVKTPTVIAYSKDDYMVLPKINSIPLAAILQENKNPNFGVLEFDRGNHCGFSIGNGWATTSSLFRTYFMSEEEAVSLYQTSKIDLSPYFNLAKDYPFNKSLGKFDLQTKAEWKAYKNKSYIEMHMSIFNRNNYAEHGDCYFYNAFGSNAPEQCYDDIYVNVPLRAFEQIGILSSPTSSFEEQNLTRWLNTHLEALDSIQNSILNTNHWPKSLLVHGNYEAAN